MPLILFKTQYTGAVPGSVNLKQRNYNKIKKEAFELVGRRWHKRMVPKHFTPAGAREYHYRRRSSKYEEAKKRRFGHKDPLKFTGEAEEKTKTARIVATSKSVHIRLTNARKLNWRNPESSIRMADEVARVSQSEEKELWDYFDAMVMRRLKRIRGTKTKTIN